MGLILKQEPTREQLIIHNNYKARYVELAKPMGGAIALAIYTLLEGVSSDADMKLKLSNTLATFICWILGEQIIHRMCIYFDLYTKAHSKNPLYRNLKTLSSLGSYLGIIIASCSHSLGSQKLSISLYSMLFSSIVGLSAFIIRHFNKEYCSPKQLHYWAQLGTEGWSKYAKTALVLGSSIGQLLGGIMSYTKRCAVDQITFYSAVASVVSFFIVILFVPLINYLICTKDKVYGVLVTSDRDVFNNNYVRSGLTLGAAVGTVLAACLGPVFFTGLTTDVAMAIIASGCSIICGIALGFCGQRMSFYFERVFGVSRDTENSWSYATRNTSYFFSYLGVAAAYLLVPQTAFMTAAMIGAASASLIGWFTGLLIIWLARKIEPDESKMGAVTLPWTQRLSSGTSSGVIIGALAGLALHFMVGGLGLVNCTILLGALGGIVGGIKNSVADPVIYQLIDKTTFIFFDVLVSFKDSFTSFISKPTTNRYSFFFDDKHKANQCSTVKPEYGVSPT